VGERFITALSKTETAPITHGYLFDEENAKLPSLGNIESTREKRTRHRRAFLNLLYEFYNTDRMLICLDPSNLDPLQDFAGDGCELRILDIQCEIDETYRAGHAQRVGLGGPEVGETTHKSLLATIAREFRDEGDALRDLGLKHLYQMRERNRPATNAVAISHFLDMPEAEALKIAKTTSLFD
jgi:hypothetical protein